MWRAGLIALGLAACTQFPQLDETIEPSTEAAHFPELVPLDSILADLPQTPLRDAETDVALSARAAALRSKAAELRREVVDSETRDRTRDAASDS